MNTMTTTQYPVEVLPVPAERLLITRMVKAGEVGPCPVAFMTAEHGWVECSLPVGHEGFCYCT
jgi:hypothetical protein